MTSHEIHSAAHPAPRSAAESAAVVLQVAEHDGTPYQSRRSGAGADSAAQTPRSGQFLLVDAPDQMGSDAAVLRASPLRPAAERCTAYRRAPPDALRHAGLRHAPGAQAPPPAAGHTPHGQAPSR